MRDEDVPLDITVGEPDGDVLPSETRSLDEASRSALYRELSRLERSIPADSLRKPYLAAVPGLYAAEITVFEWLAFLLSEVGLKRTIDALAYYRSIGWITEGVEEMLCTYARDIAESDGGRSGRDLDADDHVRSLVYIGRLTAMAES